MEFKINFALFFILCVSQCLAQRVVETSAGSFSGAQATDGDFFEFLGIPYGEVNPSNPFGPATAYPTVQGVYEANDDSRVCPQSMMSGTVYGTLDCLRLNVYVPTTATATSQLPVLVYIHGGMFTLGEGSKNLYNPKFLIRHDVIVMTIQYRLGPFGFMCLNHRAAPGNQGFKDQYLALQWIRDNIQAFGGNPNQVTLFANSAGGQAIEFHLLSEHEKLFNNVVIQSASSLSSNIMFPPDREAPLKMAAHLGLLTVAEDGYNEAISYLGNADALEVVRAGHQLNIYFGPCAETQFDDVESFIPEFWIDTPIPKAQGVPIMIGFTEQERAVNNYNQSPEHFQNLANMFPDHLNETFDFDDERLARMSDYVRRFYLGDDEIDQNAFWPVSFFETDYYYIYPVQRSIKKFIENNAGDIFQFMLSYTGERNQPATLNMDLQAAVHGDVYRYLFDMVAAPPIVTPEDQLIIDRMTTMWTNFAKYNDPTPSTSDILPITWVPVDRTNDIYHYLRIDTEMTMESRAFNRRMAFWDLFYNLNDDYQRRFHPLEPIEEDDTDSGSMIAASFTMIFSLLLVIALRH